MTSTASRVDALPEPVDAGTGDYRRISFALFLAGVATFSLLYDTQAVLPQLGAALALSPTQASLSVSVATGALALAVLPLATLSEVVGRRRTMVVALVVASVIGVLLPLAPGYGVLLGMRAVQGVALAGLPATAMAYLGEEMSARALGGAMGLYIAGNSIGGMTGRLVSGLVADVTTWRVGLAANAAVALACTVAIVVLLPASRRFRPQPLRLRPLLGGVGAALADPALRWMYAIAALLMGTFVGVYNFLGFRLTDDPFGVAPALVALLFLAYAVGSLTAPLAGRMTVRLGRPTVLAGWIVVTVVGVLLMLATSLPAVLVGLVLMTAGFFAAHSTASGWVAARAQGRARAQASGLYLCAYYAGSSIGGWAVGVPFTDHGWSALSAVVLGFLVLALGCVGAAARRVRQQS